MTDPVRFRRLTSDEQRDVAREVATIQHEGMLDPVLVFQPSGFEFSIEYFGAGGRTVPIPEFRVYAQQYLTLLAIILISYREFLPKTGVRLRALTELAGNNLNLVLCADFPLFGSGEMQPLHIVGNSFSSALRQIFLASSESISWDWQPETDHGKFWLTYPGAMTVQGFERMLNQPHVSFGWQAEMNLPYPTDEQKQRGIVLREFILRDPPQEL
jgi:hypothetical protein